MAEAKSEAKPEAKGEAKGEAKHAAAAAAAAAAPSFDTPPARHANVPEWINPATGRRWDETIPGGAYLDPKTHAVHDAEGRPLDREEVLAKGVALPPLKLVPPSAPVEPNLTGATL